MIAAHVTKDDLERTLSKVNRNFKKNIVWKRPPEKVGNRLRFTLTVIDSSKGGARRSAHNRRKVHAACWHVHGQFFYYLYQEAPTAIIKARDLTITGPTTAGGNWKDYNIGSMINPFMYSQACECEGFQL